MPIHPITIPRILMAVVSSVGVLSNSLSAWYFFWYGNTNDYGGKLILTLTLFDTANCMSHLSRAILLLSQHLRTSTFMFIIGSFCVLHGNSVTIMLTSIRFLRIKYPFMVISYCRFTYGAVILSFVTSTPLCLYSIYIHGKGQNGEKMEVLHYFAILLTISMIVVLVITVVTIKMYVVTTRGQQEGGNIEATLATRKRALATVIILNTIYVVTNILIVILLSFVIKLKRYDIVEIKSLSSPDIGLLYTMSLLTYVLPSVLRPLGAFHKK